MSNNQNYPITTSTYLQYYNDILVYIYFMFLYLYLFNACPIFIINLIDLRIILSFYYIILFYTDIDRVLAFVQYF